MCEGWSLFDGSNLKERKGGGGVEEGHLIKFDLSAWERGDGPWTVVGVRLCVGGQTAEVRRAVQDGSGIGIGEENSIAENGDALTFERVKCSSMEAPASLHGRMRVWYSRQWVDGVKDSNHTRGGEESNI
jgi:hypothetical protein